MRVARVTVWIFSLWLLRGSPRPMRPNRHSRLQGERLSTIKSLKSNSQKEKLPRRDNLPILGLSKLSPAHHINSNLFVCKRYAVFIYPEPSLA
jgi:hypothetical protein